MKLRKYFNLMLTGIKVGEVRKVCTVGFPCKLPLFPTQFAVVRPFDSLFNYAPNGWQVILIKNGKRAGPKVHRTKLSAKLYAMAYIEAKFKEHGKAKVLKVIGK